MSEDQQFADDKEMNLTGHLSELRNRLIVTAVFFVVFFILGFIYVKDIYGFFVEDLDFKLTVISPGEIIWIHFTMAGLVAFAITIPLLAFQIWSFIKPGLTSVEKKSIDCLYPCVILIIYWRFGVWVFYVYQNDPSFFTFFK